MHPSARDKRIRATAGIATLALSLLSMFMIFASGFDLMSVIPLAVFFGLQAIFTLAVGIYLASGQGKAGTLVLMASRPRCTHHHSPMAEYGGVVDCAELQTHDRPLPTNRG